MGTFVAKSDTWGILRPSARMFSPSIILLLCTVTRNALCFSAGGTIRGVPSWTAIRQSVASRRTHTILHMVDVDDITSYPMGRLPRPQLNSPAEIARLTSPEEAKVADWTFVGASAIDGRIPEPWSDVCCTTNVVTQEALEAAAAALPWLDVENALIAATDKAKGGSDDAMEALNGAILAAAEFPQCAEVIEKANKQIATVKAKKAKDAEAAVTKQAEAAAGISEAEAA